MGLAYVILPVGFHLASTQLDSMLQWQEDLLDPLGDATCLRGNEPPVCSCGL